MSSKTQQYNNYEEPQDGDTSSDEIQSLGDSTREFDIQREAANDSPPVSFRHSNLSDVRKRLLDLTARNALLNYKHPLSKSLRLANASPDITWAQLSSEATLTIEPVPEPTKEELISTGYIEIDEDTGETISERFPTPDTWAKHLGISTELEWQTAPEGDPASHIDGDHLKLQSLFFRDKLDARLTKIRRDAKASIEERGAPILYLAIGFLEWYESRTSNVPRLAPLLVAPVNLVREASPNDHGIHEYTISGSGGDNLHNLSLSERFLNDFAVTLPHFDEQTEPETWFVEVETTVRQIDPRCNVKRMVSLVLLDFTKQAMYLDLDESRWTGSNSLKEHPVISRLFGNDENKNEEKDTGYLKEHDIDNLNNIHAQYPLIAEADTSQYSAVIDAVDGRNIVIEGPPGTGKSQTITNMIAAAMAAGKRVLFVAEKIDALEVVSRRLKAAGLGDFCLELHSHKTNRADLVRSLVSAANARGSYKDPINLDTDIRRVEELRRKLECSAQVLNTKWRNTDLTPHQILQAASDRRQRLGDTSIEITGISASEIDNATIQKVVDSAERLVHAYDEISNQVATGNIRDHLWFGVEREYFSGNDQDALFTALEEWNDALVRVSKQLGSLHQDIGTTAAAVLSPEQVERFSKDIGKLPDDIPMSVLQRIDELSAASDQLEEFRSQYIDVKHRFSHISQSLNESFLTQHEVADQFTSAVDSLIEEHGVSNQLSLDDLYELYSGVCALETDLQNVYNELMNTFEKLGRDWTSVTPPTWVGFERASAIFSVVIALPPRLWAERFSGLEDPRFPDVLKQLEDAIDEAKTHKNKLDDLVDLTRLPSLDDLKNWQAILNTAGLLGRLKPQVREVRKSLKAIAASTRVPVRALINAVPTLRAYQKSVDDINSLDNAKALLGIHFNGIETKTKDFRKLLEWHKQADIVLGKNSPEDIDIRSRVVNLDESYIQLINEAAHNGLADRLQSVLRKTDKLAEHLPFYNKTPSANLPLVDTNRIVEKENPASAKSVIGKLKDHLQRKLELIEPVLKSKSLTVMQMRDLANSWRATLDAADSWNEKPTTKLFVPSLFDFDLINSNDATDETNLDTAITLAHITTSSPMLLKALLRPDPRVTLVRLFEARSELRRACESAQTKCDDFLNFGQIDKKRWFEGGLSIDTILSKNDERLSRKEWLGTWHSWQKTKRRPEAIRLSQIIEGIENQTLQKSNVKCAIEASLYGMLAEHLLSECQEVEAIQDLEQNPLRDQFAKLDKDLQELQQERIAYRCALTDVPAGNAQGAVSTHTGMNLIRREAGKKKGHIAIRQLMDRGGSAIAALKPCFMMSPMSVAQYLKPGTHEFDLIVMDEASQIRPEEALGAIGRAKQLIVVGDPKQLPPTSFFDKAVGEGDDEEDVGLQQSESILDAVLPLFEKRRLRWHYRSQHESLISFSNRHFYEGDLVLFPSPHGQSEEFGIRFERVAKGEFDDGINTHEAEHIVSFIESHLLNNSGESLGVVAMNKKQAEYIELALEARIKDDPVLEVSYRSALKGKAPLFIKNLERVQGDERDVIVISMTYGPKIAGGGVPQRFGPINSDTGWRRLNVLFTRSKKRMHVFSSMGSTDINTTANTKRGVKALRSFLEFCETGHHHGAVPTGKSPDSDFERAVMRRLKEAGYDAEPQLGAAGYYIDLAVRDPDSPGRYLLAIECDGATYHSAKSARDRDRLRQEILENLGWRVHRIWSTDWFRNSDGQMTKVLRVLDELKRQ